MRYDAEALKEFSIQIMCRCGLSREEIPRRSARMRLSEKIPLSPRDRPQRPLLWMDNSFNPSAP